MSNQYKIKVSVFITPTNIIVMLYNDLTVQIIKLAHPKIDANLIIVYA